MSNQLTIEVYSNIASGAPPVQVIETEISSSSIFVQTQEDVAPINVQVYESTTNGIFPIQVIQSEFTGVPIFVEVQEDYAPVQSVNGKIGWVVIDKNDVGLSNVENISISGVSGYLQNQINNISGGGGSGGGGSGITGDFYPNSNPSGFITGVDLSSYATITNLATTGSTLQTNINTVASNLATTGSTLNTKINNLSGVSVLTFGDQNIFGTKYFSNSVYIHDLYVTGTEFIATVQNNFIESPYILLNLTGGAIDGGIFFVTGSGLTGVNDYGPIIGFDHSKNFKFGIARRSDDLSILNDIASVQQINSYSGFVDGKYATIINLNNTGANLQTNINTVATNLVITGSTLNTRINNLSGTLTDNYVTKINGQFTNRPTVNGTGVLLSGEGVQKQTKLFDYPTGIPIYMYVGSAPFNSSQNNNVWEIYRTEIDQNGFVISNLLAQNATWTGRYFENYM